MADYDNLPELADFDAEAPVRGWERVVVKWYSKRLGCGLVTRGEGTKDIFVRHFATCEGGMWKSPEGGDRLDVRWFERPSGILEATAAAYAVGFVD